MNLKGSMFTMFGPFLIWEYERGYCEIQNDITPDYRKLERRTFAKSKKYGSKKISLIIF